MGEYFNHFTEGKINKDKKGETKRKPTSWSKEM